MKSSVAGLLSRFLEPPSGGDRGNAFEDYLAAKLTVLGNQPDPRLVRPRDPERPLPDPLLLNNH